MRVSARWQDKDRVRYQMARSLLNDASSPLNRRLRRGAQLSLDANYATSGHLPCPPAGNRGDYAPKRKPVSGMRKSPTAVFAANNSDEGLVCQQPACLLVMRAWCQQPVLMRAWYVKPAYLTMQRKWCFASHIGTFESRTMF